MKTVFVTGASRGIGKSIALELGKDYKVIVGFSNSQEQAAEVVEEIKKLGGESLAIKLNIQDKNSVDEAFNLIEKVYDHVDILVNNAGNNRPEAFLDVTPEIYEEMWRVICFGAFVVSQATVRLMLTQQDIAERQSLFFTGASGSLRGKANFSAFASGKGALRMLAQSIAREFGPQNIHVAHVVIDGAINGEKISSRFPEFLERLGEEGTLNIGAIAEAFMMLHAQHHTAWTQELDLRPFKENY